MDWIGAFASRHNLLIIEDSCHALGARWRNQMVGTLGDAAFFSSQWSKPITTGLGGWAQINSPELLRKFTVILPDYTPPATHEARLLELQHFVSSLLNRPQLFWFIQSAYRTLGAMGLAIGSSTAAELNCELPADYQKGMHPIQRRRLERLLANAATTIAIRRRNTGVIESALRSAPKNLLECFVTITDPRIDRTRQHKLIDILVIGLCTMITVGDNFTDMEDFGNYKHDWLKTFLELPNGVPSHDTFNRVF